VGERSGKQANEIFLVALPSFEPQEKKVSRELTNIR
jgi:hypothetical protein